MSDPVPPAPSEDNRPPTPRSPFENWISLSGVVVAAGSFFAFLFLFGIETLSSDRNQ